MVQFDESGMTFGPYLDGSCFRIERSDTYTAVQDGVKMAEFLWLKSGENRASSVWIVEAKQSSPHPKKQDCFKEYIDEIRDKLANALALGIAAILKRHKAAANELPTLFQTLDLSTAEFHLVLIVNGHPLNWLPPLQEALQSKLRATSQSWGLGPKSVSVLNHENAKRHGFISGP